MFSISISSAVLEEEINKKRYVHDGQDITPMHVHKIYLPVLLHLHAEQLIRSLNFTLM